MAVEPGAVDAPLTTVDDEPSMVRKLTAEFVGTLLLVAVGAGAATAFLLGPIKAFGTLPAQLQQQPGNPPTFRALLGNSAADLLPVAISFAVILAVLVYAFGGVSGGHFNPAITFALALSNRFKWSSVPLYWIVQVLGGIGGAFIVAAMFKNATAGVDGTDVLFGATTVAQGVEWPQALLAEAFITFVLMTAVMAVAVDPRAPKGWSGLIIGLALAGGILVVGPITGGSANFARSLGPFVAALVFDAEIIPWSDLYWFAAGPVIGAAAAALVYESITSLMRVGAPAPEPGAATSEGVVSPEEQKSDWGPGSPPPPPPAPPAP
ncbi:MAG: aquaporin [Actinomycetota bacterium]|nr:aquaporin [Actinomycetota bacterium]